ncbi:LysR family transcriptional regulator [Levilactobacillus suantsaii]|uniref:LysR family transcriptional regulator n=2 Tax=Levilactobacillus suantsaii TaxID=2292255 RepID=A0A4V1LFA0_9LACO|nr:LysR family transcriptional regulator [Levilactobacillus suantsaii]
MNHKKGWVCMDAKDIEMLLALDRTHSITRAAELLFINQSSLSKRLKHLETSLHRTLVIRSNQGITLSPAGNLAVKTAKQMRQLDTELRQTLATPNDLPMQGTLNLGCSVNYAQYGLPDLLVAFRRAYPQVQLNITIDYSRTIFQRLQADDIDIGIVRGEFTGHLYKQVMTREPIALICKEERDLTRLGELPFIHRKTDYHFQGQMHRWLAAHHISAITHQTITVDSLSSCVAFVAHGLGWALVPNIALHHFTGYRQILTLDGQPFTRQTYLMVKPARANTPIVSAFRALVPPVSAG